MYMFFAHRCMAKIYMKFAKIFRMGTFHCLEVLVWEC